VLFDTERTEIPCIKCGSLVVKHITMGASGSLHSRLFCTLCKWVGDWQAESVSGPVGKPRKEVAT
jgi:hypothetical protein